MKKTYNKITVSALSMQPATVIAASGTTGPTTGPGTTEEQNSRQMGGGRNAVIDFD